MASHKVQPVCTVSSIHFVQTHNRQRSSSSLYPLSITIFVTALLLAMVGCGTSNSSTSSGQVPGTSPSPAFSGINIDYAPEGRCSDNNWSTSTPAACNPQPGWASCNTSLTWCPNACQACYDGDMTTISQKLQAGTITIYQPNYFILSAAQKAGIKVILGLYDDSVSGLAQSSSATNCTYSGAAFPFCGTNYAYALFDGACGTQTPFNPTTNCVSSGAFVAAVNYLPGPTTTQFLQNGTVIGIQLGNEILGNAPPQLPASTISQAAQNLRAALTARNLPNIKVIVSLIEGQAAQFCTSSAPPTGVDYIADHVYCSPGSSGGIASSPPVWPTGSNPAQSCWTQVAQVFATDQASCGAANVFLGETGYNTGCPSVYGQQHVSDEQSFITQMVEAACQSQVSGPWAPFLFEFGDVCPAGGCLPGCSGQPAEGNGYFGIYFTQDYMTEGALVSKFSTTSSLACK